MCIADKFFDKYDSNVFYDYWSSIAKAKGIREYDVVLDRNSRKYSLKVVPLRNS